MTSSGTNPAAFVRLGDHMTIKHGFAFKGEYFTEGPTRDVLVTPGNFAIGGGFQAEKQKYYAGPVPEDYVLQPGDLIVTMTDLSKGGDTLGYPALVPQSPTHRYLHNQRIGLISISNKAALDKAFLFYRLRSDDYRRHVLATATGSTVRHTSPKRIGEFEIELPSLEEQRAIAGVLGSLDDKIEQNRRTARVLERLARAIFKAWFVDFEPVKAKAAGAASFPSMPQEVFDALPTAFVDSEIGPIPRGWQLKGVAEAIDINHGKPIKKMDRQKGPYPVFGANGVIGHSATALTRDPCIILGKIGSCGSLHRSEVPAWVSNNAFIVKPGASKSLEFAWHTLHMLDFSGYIGGSANPYMPKKNFGHVPIVFPPADLRSSFETIVRPFREAVTHAESESGVLSKARDFLLPHLLSGSVRITKADAMTEGIV